MRNQNSEVKFILQSTVPMRCKLSAETLDTLIRKKSSEINYSYILKIIHNVYNGYNNTVPWFLSSFILDTSNRRAEKLRAVESVRYKPEISFAEI